MTGVVIRSNESFEKALRRFTKTCEKTGIISDVKKGQYYEKPSEARKRQENQSRRKAVKENQYINPAR